MLEMLQRLFQGRQVEVIEPVPAAPPDPPKVGDVISEKDSTLFVLHVPSHTCGICKDGVVVRVMTWREFRDTALVAG